MACVTQQCVSHCLSSEQPAFIFLSSAFHPVQMRQEVRMTWSMILSLRWVHRCEETERGREKDLVGKMHTTMVSLHICLSWLLCEGEETQQACLLSVVCCRRPIERSLSAGAQAGDRRLWHLLHADEQRAGHHQLLRLRGGWFCQQVRLISSDHIMENKDFSCSFEIEVWCRRNVCRLSQFKTPSSHSVYENSLTGSLNLNFFPSQFFFAFMQPLVETKLFFPPLPVCQIFNKPTLKMHISQFTCQSGCKVWKCNLLYY